MIGFGYDAGTSNAAYSIIDFKPKSFDFIEVGMIDSTFKNLTENVVYKRITKADRAKAKKQGMRISKKDMPFYPPLNEEFPKFYKIGRAHV